MDVEQLEAQLVSKQAALNYRIKKQTICYLRIHMDNCSEGDRVRMERRNGVNKIYRSMITRGFDTVTFVFERVFVFYRARKREKGKIFSWLTRNYTIHGEGSLRSTPMVGVISRKLTC